ncbi:uncharacterized protein LOC108677665, partial [Hyalella azteca]|uniref:Uncharacterized protein LOC108677665 n=1 Tax=Hyalella azteca TaxID=294128 RepID=A0A8B7P675_HYAAZ
SLTRLQRQEKTLSDRLAQTVFCRTTAAKKLTSAQQQWQELRQRCEQHGQLHCSSTELQHILDHAPLQEALRVQEQEGSSLRVLLKESLGEVKEGHRLQCLLLHAVCGLHERLNSNHTLTNNLFQSVVSDLDEYRIAWADQRIEEEECAAGGDNPKPASSEPAILPPELEWLTRLDAAPATAGENETPPATQLPPLPAKSLKKSILKGSSSVLDLQDTHTSPLVVQAIAVTAEQLHKSTRANTLNNQRLSTAPVDLHKEPLQPTTPTIAQLISVPLTSISFNPTQSLNSVSASAQSNFPNHLSSSVASVSSTTVQFTACPSISSSIGGGENHMCIRDGITASSSSSFPRIKLSETIDLDGFDENNSPVLLSHLHFNSSVATTSSYSAVSRPLCLVEGSNAAPPVIADGSRNIFSVNSTWATQASMTPSHSQALPSATASIVKSTLQRQSATRNLGVYIPSCKLIPDKTDSQFINNVPGSRSGIRFSDTFSITPSKFVSEHQFNILPSVSDLRNPSILNPTANGYPKLFASSSYATLNATVDLSDTGKKITPVEQNPTVSSASVSYSGGVPGLALLNDCSNLLHSSSKGNENSQINSTFISNSCVEETSDGPSTNPYNEIRGATESNKTKLDLNGNYTTRSEQPDSDGEDVSEEDACQENRSSARQLLFNSPDAQPAGCQPSQNSTFCVEPSEGSVENLLPLNPLELLEMSTSWSLKLKSILKHSNSSSTARRYEVGGGQISRTAVARLLSRRNLSASSSLLRRTSAQSASQSQTLRRKDLQCAA